MGVAHTHCISGVGFKTPEHGSFTDGQQTYMGISPGLLQSAPTLGKSVSLQPGQCEDSRGATVCHVGCFRGKRGRRTDLSAIFRYLLSSKLPAQVGFVARGQQKPLEGTNPQTWPLGWDEGCPGNTCWSQSLHHHCRQ